MRAEQVRIEPDCGLGQFARTRGVAAQEAHTAEFEQNIAAVRRTPARVFEQTLGFIQLTTLAVQHAKQIQHVDIARFARQQVAVTSSCFVEVAGKVQLQGFFQHGTHGLTDGRRLCRSARDRAVC